MDERIAEARKEEWADELRQHLLDCEAKWWESRLLKLTDLLNTISSKAWSAITEADFERLTEEISLIAWKGDGPIGPAGKLAIRFDGPPGHESGRFIEVELDGAGIAYGLWEQDGEYWLLVLPKAHARCARLEAAIGAVPEWIYPGGDYPHECIFCKAQDSPVDEGKHAEDCIRYMLVTPGGKG